MMKLSIQSAADKFDVAISKSRIPDVNGCIRTVYTLSGFISNIQSVEREIAGIYERFGGDQRMFVRTR